MGKNERGASGCYPRVRLLYVYISMYHNSHVILLCAQFMLYYVLSNRIKSKAIKRNTYIMIIPKTQLYII